MHPVSSFSKNQEASIELAIGKNPFPTLLHCSTEVFRSANTKQIRRSNMTIVQTEMKSETLLKSTTSRISSEVVPVSAVAISRKYYRSKLLSCTAPAFENQFHSRVVSQERSTRQTRNRHGFWVGISTPFAPDLFHFTFYLRKTKVWELLLVFHGLINIGNFKANFSL